MTLTKFNTKELNAKEMINVNGGTEIPYLDPNGFDGDSILGDRIAYFHFAVNWNLIAYGINNLF
ncbi:hypothetical protein BWZ22_06380 [Seonamhaeicola sp. S2-3]|uniref:hypothetical protein n=1 Tax=Seonamhaeicola sp. S2-3 TaxID=1936081 RepID=UPI000972CA18|nr:hypothetical protein [Seonamhaeicola sp. S2-3]APY10887.1 hypothetical protein BWZ22_06380 [Seonamhaeicola sp. S2-3]